MTLRSEIAEQPAVVERLVLDRRGTITAVADRIRPRIASGEIDLVVVAARGTSDNAATYAQYLVGVELGLPVALAAPSLFSLYEVDVRLRGGLVIGISQSGRSPDVVGVVAAARRQGAPTIAVTNAPASPLAVAAEHVVDLGAGDELAVAATKTYTAELAAVASLVVALAGTGGEGLAGLPKAIAAALSEDREREAAEIARLLAGRDRLLVIGRGFEYATAREIALKLKELARVSADPYSTADFLHGPLALAEPGLPVVAVAPSGKAAGDVDAVLDRLAGLGIERYVLTDRQSAASGATASIGLPPDVPEELRPIVSIVPGQLLALHLALARGLDPESPRWIEKVTLTR